MTNVGRLSLENIDNFGEFDAIHYEGRAITNVQNERRAGAMAAVLRDRGVRVGDPILLMMPNSPDVLAAFQAAWKLGAAIIPVTPMLMAREVRYLTEDSGAQVVIAPPVLAARLAEATQGIPGFRHLLITGATDVASAENIEPELAAADPISGMADTRPDDMALLLYTSGTTGKPKGVMLTHENLASNGRSVASWQSIDPMMPSLHVLPLSHSFGVLMMNLGYILGIRATLLTHFDTLKVFETIQKFKVERFSVVPTMLSYMINHPDREKYDFSSLVRVNTGGAALPNEVRLQFEKLFKCTVKEGYGLSETSPTLTGYRDEDAYRPGSVGHAISGVEVVIMDEQNNILPVGARGEICARGPNIMRGYWNLTEATQSAMAGGWFHSGDIGFMDEDGFVYITDRKKDLIIKGGENISPREIEEAIYEHPSVAEVAVVGLPDPTFGESIWAAVVLKPGKEATAEDIKAHAAKYVTKFKVPAEVVFMPILPKNPTGKIQKRQIRDDLASTAKSAS